MSGWRNAASRISQRAIESTPVERFTPRAGMSGMPDSEPSCMAAAFDQSNWAAAMSASTPQTNEEAIAMGRAVCSVRIAMSSEATAGTRMSDHRITVRTPI